MRLVPHYSFLDHQIWRLIAVVSSTTIAAEAMKYFILKGVECCRDSDCY